MPRFYLWREFFVRGLLGMLRRICIFFGAVRLLHGSNRNQLLVRRAQRFVIAETTCWGGGHGVFKPNTPNPTRAFGKNPCAQRRPATSEIFSLVSFNALASR